MFSTSKLASLLALAVLFPLLLPPTKGTIARCQTNCISADRRKGPTHPPNTRPHPWFVAPFPAKFSGFCNLGCQLFFSEQPTNTSCRKACDYSYRYRVTVGYNDLIEQGIYECFDGCDIALSFCQAGYYCVNGAMLPCPPGTFRENQTDSTVEKCIDCPLGRYRDRDKGTSADTCSKCPKGKYNNLMGGTSVDACIRCPAGTVAEEEGMGACKNITIMSNELVVPLDGKSYTYYSNDVDFHRETVPYVGRW